MHAYVVIMQHPLLNRVLYPESPERVVQVGLRSESDVWTFHTPDQVESVIEEIQRLADAGLVVSHRDRIFYNHETLSISIDANNQLAILTDRKNVCPVPIYQFMELHVRPDDEYDYFQSEFFAHGLFAIVAAFKARNFEGRNSMIRRTFHLARYGVFWNQGFEYLKSLLGEVEALGLESLITSLQCRMPVDSIENSLFEPRVEAIDPMTAQIIGEHVPDIIGFDQYLLQQPLQRPIFQALKNILGNYTNVDNLEAPLNSQLWTPILDCLLLPNSDKDLGRLRSTVEYPLKKISGFDRELRVDYAAIAENLYPIVLAEYAASQGNRETHKDFYKLALEASSVLLLFVGRHRAPKFANLLRRVACFTLLVAGDEVEVGIVRPVFDKNLGLKGFSLSTNQCFRFRLLNNDEPELILDETWFSGDLDASVPLVDDSSSDGLLKLQAILNSIQTVSVPVLPIEIRQRPCPEALDFATIKMDTLQFIRQFGLFLHKYTDELATLYNAAGPPDEPPPRGYVFAPGLQKQLFMQSISGKNTPKKAVASTSNLFFTPAGKKPKKKQIISSLLQTGYFFPSKPLKSWDIDSEVLVAKGSDVTPRKAVFIVKSENCIERSFLTYVAPKIPDYVPKIVLLTPIPDRRYMLIGMEHLLSIGEVIGQGFTWPTKVSPHLCNLTIDILMAVDKLAQMGWIHGNVSAENIRYSKESKRWKLTSFETARPIGAVCEPAKSGTSPYNDPAVRLLGRPKSVQSEIFSMGAVLEHVLTSWLIPYMSDPVAVCTKDLVDSLYRFKDLADFLMTRPSMLDALERVYPLASSFVNGRKRLVRLEKAMSKHKPAAPEINITQPRHSASLSIENIPPGNQISQTPK